MFERSDLPLSHFGLLSLGPSWLGSPTRSSYSTVSTFLSLFRCLRHPRRIHPLNRSSNHPSCLLYRLSYWCTRVLDYLVRQRSSCSNNTITNINVRRPTIRVLLVGGRKIRNQPVTQQVTDKPSYGTGSPTNEKLNSNQPTTDRAMIRTIFTLNSQLANW
jgi:hypothetical protein